MADELAMFSADATRSLVLLMIVFFIAMLVAAINIVHFHHRRARWQEAVAAAAGAVALILFGLSAISYSSYGYQVMYQVPATIVEFINAATVQTWLVNGAIMALAGASVCIFAGILGIFGLSRMSARPNESASNA